MEQHYLFPRPAHEPASSLGVEPAVSTAYYRPTVVYRLPQAVPVEPFAMTEGLTAKRLFFHLFLLGLTVITTFFVGVLWLGSFSAGVVYSFTVLSILAAHEMGHYIACRWYGVDATLPYFIPVPIPPVGTFGAFIKIKSPIPSRRALFDIGIAGPLAGFVFVIPATLIAFYFAEAAPPPVMGGEYIYFQDPLLFKFFQWLVGAPPNVMLNPVMWAAWIGVFMTSLNLLPVGQLDGGHVTYAVFGRSGNRALAWICYVAVIGLALYSAAYGGTWNWVVYAVILTFMLRVGHPPVMDEDEPLGRARIVVAFIGLLVFVLSFMPFPISF